MITVEMPEISRVPDCRTAVDAYASQRGWAGYIFLADMTQRWPTLVSSYLQLKVASSSACRLIDLYQTLNFAAYDPIAKHVRDHALPVIWTSEEFLGSQDPKHRELFRLVEKEGFKGGISIPYHGPINGMFVALDVTGCIATERAIQEIKDVIPFAFSLVGQAIRDIPAGDDCRLTRRELECLHWVAKGKTSWEIGKILDIGQRTVDFHVKNAIVKLDAMSRNQAIYEAMRRGLIPLSAEEEAIPELSPAS